MTEDDKAAPKKAPAKKAAAPKEKTCSSSFAGAGVVACTQPEGHEGHHSGADNLTWH